MSGLGGMQQLHVYCDSCEERTTLLLLLPSQACSMFRRRLNTPRNGRSHFPILERQQSSNRTTSRSYSAISHQFIERESSV